ncbi:hypothetical protein AD952_10910 [Acetobacter cerevisiae]|uniref:Uncharacterized protein n=1 Tax=Acetobacter cerevisiae TaxID=178900 RepID=A0A149UTA8_9PROT|nr:hypothetical protein AD952_10910 [Acetobacter cerevisiae]KXV77864.1 hypothetical protein AD954_05575 [Acetobacter cerevisiae]
MIQCFLSEKKNRFESILSVTQMPQSFLDSLLPRPLTVKVRALWHGGILARSGGIRGEKE